MQTFDHNIDNLANINDWMLGLSEVKGGKIFLYQLRDRHTLKHCATSVLLPKPYEYFSHITILVNASKTTGL